MYCRNCGHKLEEGDKFCSSCGAKTGVENDANVSAEGAGAESIAAGAGQSQGESVLGDSKPLFEPFDFSKIDLALGIDDKQEQGEAEKKSSTVEEFDWNIHTFPGMEVEKTEDIDFNWSMPVEEPEPAPAPAPPAPPAPEPIPEPPAAKPEPAKPEQKIEPIGFTAMAQQRKEAEARAAQAKPATPKKKEEPAQQEPLSGLEERLFGELDSKTDTTRKQSEEMDKFFTFHKKNEEFQKLLDQEYEKIKSGNMLSDEMDTATVASEEKFATRKPEDPMEELFASSGVVKGYEPKPIETDVLERIEAAEAEKRAREESARLVEEEKARARKEAEEKARQEAEEKARQEAEEKARQEAEAAEEARIEAEQRARQEAEEKARQEAEAAEKARIEAAEKARQEAEAAEKAAREAEEAARLRLEADAKRVADARAAQEAAEREQARMAAREDAVATMRNMEAEEQRIKAETEAKLEEQAAKIQAEIARQEAEAAILQAEAAKKEAEEARAKALAEMQKAQQEKEAQEFIEEPPVKTKAVNKAEILAGMATATEMVERDRAFAAAEAAAKAKEKEEAESIELPDFLGHLDETEQKKAEEPAPSIDIFEELTTIEKEAEQPQEEKPQEEVLSLEDLLAEEEKGPEPIEIITADEPQAPVQEPEQIQEPEPEPVPLEPEEPEAPQQEEEPEQAEETAAEPEKKKRSASSDTAEQTPVKKEDEEEDEDDDEEEESGGKGRIVLKICLVILIILLALEVAGVVIKVAMPNSDAAKFIDSQLNKVIQMVTGDDVEYRVLAAEEDIRTEPVQDKTELIKAEMGKNKDGNIETVEYNADLKYDPQKDYENTDINLTQELADVTWYKDASDKQVYFDQAIVGAVIAYDSQRVNLVNYGDESVLNLVQKGTDLYKQLKDSAKKGGKESMKLLQIGEIRQAGSSYFVWVAEKIGGTKTKKIYQMTPEGEMMKLTASYEL